MPTVKLGIHALCHGWMELLKQRVALFVMKLLIREILIH
jgi:hypothetical protein